MRISRFFIALSAVLAASGPALAATEISVQFGSFETREEAQKRINDINSSHSGDLGGLAPTIREVKLPPDNLTVFRTQAGPLDSRLSAQSLCLKFSSRGDECYVVETVARPDAPKAAEAPKPVAPAALAAPTPITTPAPVVAAPTPAPISSIPPTPALTAPSVSPEMQAALDRAVAAQRTGNVSAPVAVPAPVAAPAPTAAPAVALAPLPALAARSLPPFPPPPAGVAAAPKPTPAAAVAVATAPEEKESPSFWSRVFGDDEDEDASEQAPPVRKPLKSLASADDARAAPTPVVTAAPLPPAAIAIQSTAGSPPHLLPPPAPLAAPATAAPVPVTIATSTVPAVAPISSAPLPPAAPATNALPAQRKVIPNLPPAGAASRVEEAKRVPLSETSPPAPAAIPHVSLLPSSTLGQKTLWAQVGQFKDMKSALDFWTKYRQLNPDFPVVRVRVVSSVQQQVRGNDKVWLRVGPFARMGFIENLCQQFAESDDETIASLRCGNVVDTGVAGTAGSAPGYLNGSRYRR